MIRQLLCRIFGHKPLELTGAHDAWHLVWRCPRCGMETTRG